MLSFCFYKSHLDFYFYEFEYFEIIQHKSLTCLGTTKIAPKYPMHAFEYIISAPPVDVMEYIYTILHNARLCLHQLMLWIIYNTQ